MLFILFCSQIILWISLGVAGIFGGGLCLCFCTIPVVGVLITIATTLPD